MKTNDILIKKIFFLIVLLSALSIDAQVNTFKPESGQQGKDVIWVPTSQELVEKMLDMAKVGPGDYLMDLGSGDGRLVIAAAKRGATALGIEYDPNMIKISRDNAAKAGVSDMAKFTKADLFKADLSKATVVTLFLLTNLNLRLRPTLLDLKPGTRIVSNTFDMGEWEPDEQASVTVGCDDSFCKALLWIVPAKVEGNWKVEGGELIIRQEFQKFTGTLNSEVIKEGRIKGNEISFKVNGNSYKGTIKGNQIYGSFSSGKIKKEWTASYK